MSWDLIQRHVAAIKASVAQQQAGLDLIASQVAGFEAWVNAHVTQATARQELPDHCNGQPADSCALQSEDAWMAYGNLTNPRARYCKGCRALSSNGVTLDP